MYLPDKELFSEKLVAPAHKTTLHGGVGLTMAKVRERYWVPRLRQLTKRVIRNCNGCKRFQCLCTPPSRKSTKGQNQRFFAISSNQSQLRWTYQVPSQVAERGEGIHRAVCLQPDKGTILGIAAGPHHGGIHQKPKEVGSKTRKAGKDLFQ